MIFTSDHGPWYQGSPGLLRGRKASSFEGGFRVPFLLKWPGTLQAGKVRDAWTSSLDVLPTLAAICGLPLPQKPLDGINVESVWLAIVKPKRNGNRCSISAPWATTVWTCTACARGSGSCAWRRGIGGEIYINDRTTETQGSAWLQDSGTLQRDPGHGGEL